MQYLYYKIWQLFSKIKTNDMPATNAALLMALFQLLNLALFCILALYYLELQIEFKSNMYQSYLISSLVCFPLIIINYLFLYKKRNRIYNKYKDESKKQSIRGNIILVIYVLISFTLVFYFGPKYTNIMK